MSEQASPKQGAVHFDDKVSSGYDERNRRIAPIQQNLHLLTALVLKDLPENARVLCVGVGTGAEILALAAEYPGWRFTGVEPAAAMLAVCRAKVEGAGLADRCDLHQGYLDDLPPTEAFDAVLCILVTQFVLDPGVRQAMFGSMADRLKPGGYLVNAEITGDMDSPEFTSLAGPWQAMHEKADPHSAGHADKMIETLRQKVAVVPPAQMEKYLRGAGFPLPVRFYQSLFIHAWYSRKGGA